MHLWKLRTLTLVVDEQLDYWLSLILTEFYYNNDKATIKGYENI